MAKIDVLLAVKPADADRYYKHLSVHDNLMVTITTSLPDMLKSLADVTLHTDVLAVDNNLDRGVYDTILELRVRYPRLFIVLIDEEVDFAMPGQADDISTEPFRNDDLAKRISRLISERRQETLRSDSLPAVRQFVKRLRNATGVIGKQEAAVQASKEMNYDYVALYQRDPANPARLIIKAQEGSKAIQAVAPKEASADDLMGWVQANGQSRIAAPEDKPNHPLVARGRLGAVACIPIMFNGVVYGVLAACRERPGTITQENVMMLELICSQLAAALSKEQMG